MMQKQRVWVDADTGNETDDAYAIVRLLIEPTVNVVGVSSAHFNNADLVAFEMWNQYPTDKIKTVEISQELNEAILRLMHKEDVRHPIGADRQIGRAWGGSEPRPSPASEQLIAVVQTLASDEKLDVLCLGAFTNIASAVLLEPSILPKIRCYALGAKYNLQTEAWDKNDFNIRNDLSAFDVLLNEPALDFTIMPTDVAYPYQFDRETVYETLGNSVPILKFLTDRWRETNPDDQIRILWDLALIEAYVLPEKATIRPVLTPPENTKRTINAYSDIDIQALTDDFWQSIEQIKASYS